MNLHETHILCEALTQFVENANEPELRSKREAEDVAIAEQLLERYTEAVCTALTEDYRARLH